MHAGISANVVQLPRLFPRCRLSSIVNTLGKATAGTTMACLLAAVFSVVPAAGQSSTSNAAPVITNPGDKTYEQGEEIAAFGITVTDADADTVTVTVTGLPSGLSYTSDQVQGTVATDAAAQDYTVTISADDGVNAAVTETFTVTVTEPAPANAPPVITDPGDKTYEQGEEIAAFGITVTDTDADTVTVTLSGLPSGLSYTSDQVQGTVATDAAAQDYTVTISADDGVNAAVTETFTVTVTEPAPANAPPVITAPADKTYEQGEEIAAFGITVTDADADTVTVTLSGLPSGLSYTSDQVQGTVATDAAAQDYTVTISADDGVNAAVTETFTVTVTEPAPANAPPVITDPGDKTYEQGEEITAFGITVTDADSDTLTVTVTGLPSGLSYTSDEVQGTVATDAAAQDYTVTISADDGVNAAVTETFTVTVTEPAPANAPPVITDPGDKTYEQGEEITAFGITVTDADSDTLTVTVTGLPSGLSYTSDEVQGTVATDAAAQDYTVTISADDGVNAAVTETFTVTVTEPAPANAPPVITAPADKTYEQGEEIAAFGITVTDADADTLTVTLSGLPSGLSYTSDQVQGTVATDAAAQDYTVTISADDGVNAAVTETFTVTVTEPAPANAPPVITDPGDKTYEQGEAITAFGITVTDADSDTLTVTLSGLPSGLSYTSDQVQGTVATDAAAQDYTVTISADDGVNAAVTETFTVTVTEPAPANAPPVITDPGDKTYEQGEAITAFGITVTDADSDTLTVTVTGLPSGLSYTSDEVQGTVATDAAAQDYTVTISADDGVNAAVTETFTVTVTEPAPANAPPVITDPGDKTYEQGEEITAFGITVTDADSDTLTVTVTGLPSGLSYTSDQVQGTVATDAAAQDYTVTISADDGVNTAVTATFTVTVAEPASTGLAPSFSVTISGLSFQEGEDAGETVLPEADGGDGELTYSLAPALPEGLSFAAGTRTLSGTPTAAGEYAMTYTATDEDGDETAFTFTITVLPPPPTARSVDKPVPTAPTVTRTEFSEPTAPALDVTWTKPDSNGLTVSWYNLQYRKQGGNWTVLPDVLETESRRLTNLEAGATYEVQVRAGTNEQGLGPWSNTGSGTANRPPNATSTAFNGGTFPVGSTADYNETGQGALGVFFADADSDALTYSAASQHPALLGVSLTGAAGEARLRATLLNQGSSKLTFTASDAYGGSVTRTVTIAISAKTSRSIAENSPAGTAVGAPVTGTPYDGEALTYSLTGNAADSGLFVIDSSTGQISVKQSATLDYETDDSYRETETRNGKVIAKFYRGKVEYTVDGIAAAINVSIILTDVEAGKPGAPTVTRTEFSEPTNPALDVTWTVPDTDGQTITGYKAQYRKKAAAGADPAAWTAYSGTLGATATTFNLSDLEAGATYEAQVLVVTGDGDGSWSDTGEGTANRPPNATSTAFNGGTFPVGSTADYNETGQGALGVFFADADSDALTYSAASQHPALLGVSLTGAAGEARLRATLLNQGSSKLTFTASDAYGGSVTRTVTIAITAKESRSIAENSPAGTAVGDPVTGTPYGEETLSYTLTGDAATVFTIGSSTGQISVKQGATIDYETKSSYTGQVTYTVQGQTATIDLTINVTEVEAGKPGAPTLTRTEFSEPTAPALDVTWTAPDTDGQAITGYKAQYRKKAAAGVDPAAWTAYSGTLGATATTFNLSDLEAGATYEAQVRIVTGDGDGSWSDTGEGTANRPPNATSTAFNGGTFPVGSTADYNETGQGALGVFFADADSDALTYSAAAQHPALLGVSLTGAAGEARLRATLLNQGSSKLTFTASDAYGGSVTRTVTIAITAKESRSIAENSPAGTAVGAPVTGTPYDGEALTYSLTGNAADSGLFVIDSSTGQISVKQGATLDYETDDSYRETETRNGEVTAKFYRGKVEYTVDDHAAVINVNINVTDVATGKPGAPTLTRTEFSEPTDPALDVTWTAPDTDGQTITGYKAQYRKKAAAGVDPAAWTAYSGTLGATATTFNLAGLEASATYEAQVLAVTGDGDGSWSDTGEGKANRPPNATSTAFNGGTFPVGSIADYKETGQGALGVFFADADSDALTYSAAAQHPALLGVSLTGAAGEAQLRATLLNQGSSKLTFTASDAYGGSVTRTVTIAITAKESRSIAENSPAGTAVGAPVTGTPYDGEALTYSLTGNAADSGLFVIDSSTGQISVKQGATLDYETDDSYRETETRNGEVTAKFYRGKVEYTVDDHAAVINVNINVTDVATGKPGAPTLTRTEFSEPTDPALDVTWTAPDTDGQAITGYKAQYRKKAAAGVDPAAWTAYSGTLGATATTFNLAGLEAGATYEAQVLAVTGDGDGSWSDTGEGTANTPPNATSTAFNGGTFPVGSIADYKETGQGALGVFFADADSDALTYSAASQHPALLGVSLTGAAGEAQLRATLLNQGSSKLTFTASDAYGGSVTRTVTIAITAKESRSIAENSPAGTAVGDPVTGTPYDGEALTYSLTGNAADSGLFVIDSSTGQISVKQGATLDYETDDSYRETATWQGEVTAKFYRGKVEYTVDDHAAVINVNIVLTDVDETSPAAVTIADASANEGDAITFTVTLDKAVSGGLTVTPSFTDGTATKGTDYTENTSALTFTGTAGETQSFTVATIEDTDKEHHETFTVGLAVSGTSATVTATDTATGTITNDDGALAAVTIGDASANEGDAITFTVTLDKAVSGGLTVTPSFTDVTATKGTDYTQNTSALTFTGTAGETKSFTVATTEDTDVEPNETFTVGLAVSGSTATVTATDTASGTITDDDSSAVTIADASANEGDAITFTVTLDRAVSGGLKVTPSFTDGTATKGTDYTENTSVLTFTGAAGETKSFTVSTTEDTDVEPNETFTVGLAVSGTTATVTATDTASGTITDDDSAAVTIGDASANEGDAVTFTVTLDKAVAGGLKATPSFTDGTATEGTDYTENTGVLTFTGAAGETKSFTVATTEDTVVEANETFTVGLAVSGTTATVTATDTATGTVTDDDSAAVTIGDASAEEGNSLTFTVTLDNAVSGGLTVTPSFTDGTATKGTDYTENTSALTFTGTAGETQSFTVATIEDTDKEHHETFTVGLAVSGTSATVTATDTATGTITNDDGALAAVSVGDASANEGDAITFTVTLDKAVSGGLTVTPSFTDGTATKGTDYTQNTSGLTFTGTAGETQSFTVATTEDTDVEPNETFTVGLSVSGSTATVTATDTATGTITDDDSSAVTIGDASANEGDAITFTVTLDKAVSGGLKVTPSFTDGTATEGTDYTENTGVLTFTGAAGETKSFTVSTTEDTDVEPNETFTVALAVSGTTATVTATDTATGTITDDDSAAVTIGDASANEGDAITFTVTLDKAVTATDTATGTITDDDSAAVTIGDASANEGDAITFTVTLDKAVSGGLKVTPSFTDGTATEGTDYTENTGVLTFAGTAGETKSFTVATTEDTVVETNETFTVGLAVSGTTATVTATDTATGTITDDDSAAVTIADASANEGDAITFTVTLDKAVSGGLTVTPSFTDVTATKGTDYTQNTSALTFTGTAGETQSFTVATIEDTDKEHHETFTVGLAVSGAAGTVTATDTATGTITNDDGALAAVTFADASANEGDAVTFTVTLDKAVSGGLTVTPSFADGTATKGTDYTQNTSGLTFTGTAGETKSFTVATTEDTDVEPNETFTVGLSVSGSTATVTATDTATGTITDDDSAAVTIADASANEGDAITFTVTLGKAVSGGLKVTPSFTDGTATEGTDYTQNTGVLTFTGAAGETKSFTVSTTEDTDVEPNETFTVGLAVSGTTATVTATDTASGTITDDDSAAVTIGDASANEGDAVTFTVTLDKAVAGGLKATPSFTDGTATEGTDYTENTGVLTFAGAAGETKSFTVATTEDTVVEANETFTVGLAVSGTTATVTATDTATGTVTDDDSAAVTIGDASAEEGNSLTFTVTLDNAVAGGLQVTPSFTDVTATKGTDYTQNTSALTFTGTAGETQSFTVATIEDTDKEHHETFTVGLAVSGAAGTVTATDTATGTITNDDGALAAVSVGDASANEGDAITFTVTLDKAVSGGLTVTPSFTDGTATKGTDYTQNTSGLTFTGTAGETQSFTVATTEDTDVEPNETFIVGLAVSGSTATVTATDTATGTITDDDNSAVTIADASAEEGDSLTFTVTLGQAVAGGLQVTPSFTDVTATKGTDYTENTSGLTFTGTAGETKSFTVSTTEDTDVEPNETFTVALAVSGTTATVTATDTASGTITDDDSAAVTIADASAAEGDAITFTVTLDKAVSGGLKVTPSFTDATATEGTDYTENTSTLTFTGTAGETKSFTVATTEDTVVEANETFTVGLAVSGTTATVTATDTASGTITDDDSAAVTIGDASAEEGNSLTFTVTLDKAVSGGLKVTPSFTDGTATKGTDYTENTAALTFTGTAGETQSFTVATIEDTDKEHHETFTVGLAVSGAAGTVTATDTATGTITNDDGALAAVSVGDASANEGDAITFTVTLDKAVSGGLTVTPSFADGTATKGTDYTENTSGLTFTGTAGETKSFTVATTEDTDVEPNETFTVGLSVSGSTATVTATDTATGTITDDDSAAVTIADASANEGDAITFTVTLGKAVSGGLKVTPSFTDGTATEGTDYTQNTGVLTFTGAAGETKSFTVSTTEDTDVEPDETFTVGLAVSGTTATVTATDTASGTITDDDSAAVTIGDASANEGDAITFTVTLDKAVSGGLKVTPSFTDATATEGTDYTENTGVLTFAGTAGETKSFTVATTEDTVVEANETFTVGLAVSGTTATVTATDTATGTVTDDDSAAVTIGDASAEEGNSLTFTVTLDKAVSGGLKVTPSFTDGTATKGTDYTENTAALTFTGTAGETKSFTVATIEDTDKEHHETFTVGLAVSGAAGTVTATDTATGTITNDDGALAAVSVGDASANEGDAITFTVTLDKAVSGGLTVTPSFADGTATKGTDYTENTSGLTFTGTAGETKSFTVATTEDTDVEPNETFTVGLAVSGSTATVTATDTATGTITDDDNSAVTIADASANEGDAITFTVTLDKDVSGGLQVTPSFTDVTATKGTDYTENTGVLTFTGAAGETKSFTVATTEDTDVEPDETFTVGLAVSGTTATVTATDTASGTITDDDSAAVTIGDASANEGDSITFTVTLDKAVGGGLKVTPSFTDATATEGTDYTENTGVLTFAGTAGETQSFTVATTEDTVVEANETFTVGLAVSGTTATVTATDTATGTVTDDDSAAVTIGDASANEGDAITFTVTLDKAVSGGLTVTPSFTDGTATKGTDYTENTAALTFTGTAGETKSFTVATIEDTDKEHHETFTVGLAVSGTSATVTATDTATGTITNDDGALAAVTIGDASANEGDAFTFTVTLDKAVSGGLTVTPSFTDGTATKGTDYTENTAALTFTGTAGETQSFTVATTEDTDVEPTETFTVGLAVSETTATVTATDTATGTITDDDSSAVTIADASAKEGNAITFTVTLDKAVSGGLKVTPSFTDGTAAKGIDYTENTAALTFTGTAGETQSFTVATTEDEVVEDNETFTVGLTVSGTSAAVTATDTATGTIKEVFNDNGDPGRGTVSTVTIVGGEGGAEDAEAAEGESLTFAVTLNQAVQDGLTVTPSFTDGTATKGTDYTENTAALTFAGTAGETKSFTVATIEDTDVEPNETFTVSLKVSDAPSAVTVGGPATGTINDDDSAAVTIDDASAAEGDSITFTVTLDKAVSSGLTVTPSFTDGTATKGTDYTENTAALTFAGTAGETKSFTVATTQDTDVETDETFTVSLSVSGTTATVTATDTATGTITDDDGSTGSATVTIADASAAEGEDLTFTVTLDNAVSGGLKVTPGFTDVTATSGTDYTENTTAITFTGTAGETQSFTVATTQDANIEGDETFTVSLAVSGSTATVTATDTATGTITDDDGNAAVTITDASAAEGDPLSFTVTLDQAVAGGLTVTPSFTDGTATSGTDYTENTTAITFTGTAGETQSFTVATTQDANIEGDETFTVSLAVSGSTATVTATDTATGTITNDDGSAAVTIADASANEGDSITFTVTLDEAVAGGLTVTPRFTDGTATSGTDYTENTALLSFTGTAGETQTFTVATTEDVVAEANETFTVSLTVSHTTAPVTATDTATGTIANDDSAAVTIADASANEGDALTFTVTLDKAVSGGLTVTPGFTDVTATKDTDYTENTTALTFAGTAGETRSFTVATTEDPVVEADETFTVSLSVSKIGAAVTATDTATGTINNDDGGGGNNGGSDTETNHAPVALADSITVSRGGTTSLLSTEYKSSYFANRGVYSANWAGDPSDDTNNDWDRSRSPLSNFFWEASVLANDSDLEDRIDHLSVELVTPPDHGHLTLNRDGTFSFTHDGSRASHEDRFTYRVKDSRGALSNEATVTITVTGVNAGPESEPIPDQVLMLGKDGRVDLPSYFTDPDGDPLTYEARASDGSSTVEVNLSDSVVVLTPMAVASTRVTVTARDPEGLSAEQSFGVRVETVQERRNRLLELSLAAFGRTVASQAVDAISRRFDDSPRKSQATFSGQSFDLEFASDDQSQSRMTNWLQSGASLLGMDRGYSRPDPLTGTPASGRPVPGQWDMAGRQTNKQTVFSNGSGLTGGSGGGGIGGGSLQLATPSGRGFNRFSGRSLMSSSSFQYAPDQDGSKQGNWMLWGQGVRSDFYGQPQAALGLDGRVGAAYLGADRRWGSKVVAGVAASHSVGALDYANGGDGENELEVGARLTSAHPYVKWSPRPGLDLWGLMGYGRGAAELEVAGESVEMGIDIRMAALGGRSELTRLGAVDLALKADAFAVSIGSEAVEGLRVANGDTQRTRLMLEGRTDWSLSSHSTLTPSLGLGARMDGGDAETGLGAELAGGASFANRRLGLVVEAGGHWLIAHQDRNFKERGARLAVRLDPGADGKGWGFTLAPLWGNNSGGSEALWRNNRMLSAGRNRMDGRDGVHWQPDRTQAALSYGLETWGGRGRLGPFARMDLEDTNFPSLGGGMRLDVLGAPETSAEEVTDGLRLELFGDYQRRRQSRSAGLAAGPAGSYEYRFGIGFVLNF